MNANRKILIITGAIIVFTFIATNKFIYHPHTQQFQNMLKVLDEEYEKNRIFFEIKKIEDEISLRASKELLKSEKDLPWLLGKISDIFNLLRLEVTSMEPQPLEKTAFYTIIPVKVKTVCSYHAVGELVSKLESLDKFIDISYLELRNLAELYASKERSDASGEAIKKTGPLRRPIDDQGFVLAEVTFKLNAVYLH
jgi:hypothetical protein